MKRSADIIDACLEACDGNVESALQKCARRLAEVEKTSAQKGVDLCATLTERNDARFRVAELEAALAKAWASTPDDADDSPRRSTMPTAGESPAPIPPDVDLSQGAKAGITAAERDLAIEVLSDATICTISIPVKVSAIREALDATDGDDVEIVFEATYKRDQLLAMLEMRK